MGGRVVVGVDGSSAALVALRWAVEEAARRDAILQIVQAWEYPYVGEVTLLSASGLPSDSIEGDAKEMLEEAVAQAGRWNDEVVIEPELVHGFAPKVLLARAAGADLLVVGTRGRGGFAGLLLGSVSQECAHDAPCPLVIVPPFWH